MGKATKNPGKEKLEGMLREGMMVKDVAGACGVSPSTVSHWLHAKGLDARKLGRKGNTGRKSRNPGRKELERLHIQEGKPLEDISGIYGVSPQTARRWMQNCSLSIKEKKKETSYSRKSQGRNLLTASGEECPE